MEIQRAKAVMSSAGLRLAVAPDAGAHLPPATGLQPAGCAPAKSHVCSLLLPIASSVCLRILWFVLQIQQEQCQ